MTEYTENQRPAGLNQLTDATIDNADIVVVGDNSDSGYAAGITWAYVKAALKTYFDTLYPAETATTLGATIGGAGDATPNDTDFVATSLTAAGILKKITWTNAKAFLKTYFDTVYAALAGSVSQAFSVASLELGHATDTTISRVSAGVIAVEGVTVDTASNTLTLTNKRITPRILSAASYTTDTGTSLNCDNLDEFIVTAQAGALKLNNPTGTPTDGQVLFVAVTGTAARALTYDTQFEASTVALPTTTVTTARLNMLFIWRADTSKWTILAAV